MKKGNCYVTCEALYHLLGGKRAGWKPMLLRMKPDNHWFLQHKSGLVLDPTREQFGNRVPNYALARGCGFLTLAPSKRARVMMKRMVWQESP